MGRTRWVSLPASAVLFAGVAFGSLAAAPNDAVATQPGAPAQVRVDQVGYLPTDAKHAYLMASHRVKHATWDVVDAAHHVVAHGNVGATNRGPWNTNYPDVYDITFNGFGSLGTYHLTVHGDASAHSPAFARVGSNRVSRARASSRRSTWAGIDGSRNAHWRGSTASADS